MDDDDIPDLLPGAGQRAPARPAVPPKPAPATSAVPATPAAATGADLEFDLLAAQSSGVPWDVDPVAAIPALEVKRPSRAPAASDRSPARPSRAPAARSDVPPRPSDAPTSLASAGLDLEAIGWDLDGDLTDAASLQLNVALQVSESDDGPWPLGRTPESANLAVPLGDAARKLGVERPTNLLGTAAYFWKARRAVQRLSREARLREVELQSAEDARARALAGLAEGLRPSLEGRDRFAASYDLVQRHAEAVRLAEQALEQSETRGGRGLLQLDAELETARSTAMLRNRDAEDKRVSKENGARDLARLEAQAQRLQIERRNVVALARERAGPGQAMPPELAQRYLELEHQLEALQRQIATAAEIQKKLDTSYRTAEDEEHRARADLQRLEARKEGLLVSQQGTALELREELERARAEYRRVLAGVGLAIVELRGEIPVGKAVREELLHHDAAVSRAVEALELVRHAVRAVDRETYARGKWIVAGAISAAILALGWALVGRG